MLPLRVFEEIKYFGLNYWLDRVASLLPALDDQGVHYWRFLEFCESNHVSAHLLTQLLRAKHQSYEAGLSIEVRLAFRSISGAYKCRVGIQNGGDLKDND